MLVRQDGFGGDAELRFGAWRDWSAMGRYGLAAADPDFDGADENPGLACFIHQAQCAVA